MALSSWLIADSKNEKTLVILLIVIFPTSADSMRCGNKLIVSGDTKAEVLIRCGEPMLKEVLRSESTGRQFRSGSDIQTGQSTDRSEFRRYTETTEMVEQWTYNQGWGKFLRLVIFRGGRVDTIEDGPRMENN